MTTLLVLNTTNRPQDVDYFTETVKRVDAAGASALPQEDKLIYSDGPFGRAVPKGWNLIETPESVGTLPSLEAIVKLTRNRGSDLVFLEDDIILVRNAITKMVSMAVPEKQAFLAFFDFYTPKGHKKGIESRQFQPGPLQAGVQAVKIPLRSLKFMWPEGGPELVMPPTRGKKSFGRLYALKFFFNQLSPYNEFGMYFPHLVQHVGEVSAVNGLRSQKMAAEGIARVSANFPGEDFDANTLS